MSKRSQSVRKLIAEFPAPPELQKLMGDLYEQADRVAAIMGSAIVENVLERLIKVSFVSRSAQREGLMFGNAGALQNFSSKIQVAAAFGIIAEPLEAELSRLKDIRNIFAHAASNVDFSTPAIAELSDGLTLLETIRAFKFDDPEEGPKAFSGKQGFVLATIILVIAMDGFIQEKGGEPVYLHPPTA